MLQQAVLCQLTSESTWVDAHRTADRYQSRIGAVADVAALLGV